MDISECYSILAQRQQQHEEQRAARGASTVGSASSSNAFSFASAAGGCPACSHCCLDATSVQPPSSSSLSSETPSGQILQGMSNLELLNLFTTLQSERVQTYRTFESSLSVLLEELRVGEYPHLCAEITSIFIVISRKIIAVKEELIRREETQAARLIADLQNQEKEKLSLVAASHLDRIRQGFPAMTFGVELVSNNEYATSRIFAIEQRVQELVEEIQALKHDLI